MEQQTQASVFWTLQLSHDVYMDPHQFSHNQPSFCKIIEPLTMDVRITQQAREDVARQLQQWATARNVPLAQIERMLAAILSGQNEAQILQARLPTQASTATAQQQQPTFVPRMPALNFQSLFDTFPMPPMPMPMPPIIPAHQPFPPPASTVPAMFPNIGLASTLKAPNVQATRTIFPGGEALQQNSSYSGQHGTTTFKYSSSSTSMTYTPGPHLPFQPTSLLPLPQHTQHPLLPAVPLPRPAPLYAPEPVRPYQQQLHEIERNVAPQSPIPQHEVDQDVHVASPSPEAIFNPAAAGQEPQNERLAETFRRQLDPNLDEATCFSDIPEMPDQSVRP